MMEFFSEQVCRRKQDAFGDAAALRRYRFEHDNGRVPQLEQARRYAAQWKQMREQNLGLLFWGKPGNGKTFAAACIANALLESEERHVPTVNMTTLGTILNRLPGMSAQDKDWYLKGILTSDLLILDDFSLSRPVKWLSLQMVLVSFVTAKQKYFVQQQWLQSHVRV